MRSEAQITYQNAKTAYEDYKAQKPAAPVMSDFTGETDIVSDGTSADVSASASSSTDDTAVTAEDVYKRQVVLYVNICAPGHI